MAHVNATMVAALRAAVTGLPTTGSNVFADEEERIQAAEIPALVVYPVEDELIEIASRVSRAVSREARRLTLAVRVIAASEAQMHAIRAEVEVAVATVSVGDFDLRLRGTAFDTERGESKVHQCEIRYGITYVVNDNDPEVLQ